MTQLIIHRTNVVTEGPRGRARRLFYEVPGRVFLPGIENADDPDMFPEGVYELVMATMANADMPGLWREDTEEFVHAANYASQLKGCNAPGMRTSIDGVKQSRDAMEQIFRALGGFEEGRRIYVEVIAC